MVAGTRAAKAPLWKTGGRRRTSDGVYGPRYKGRGRSVSENGGRGPWRSSMGILNSKFTRARGSRRGVGEELFRVGIGGRWRTSGDITPYVDISRSTGVYDRCVIPAWGWWCGVGGVR